MPDPQPAKKSPWSEYKNADGRTYWAHATTKQSVWEKPDELRTPFERALAKTDWKQYTSQDRPYYVNSKTKETKWDLPEELVRLKRRVEREEEFEIERQRRKERGERSPTPPTRTPTPGRSPSPNPQNTVATLSRAPPPAAPKVKAPPPRWPVGGFLSHEKAEEGFMKLLAYYDVDETSAWEETHRKIITHELYKALDTLAEKKAAFEKFQRNIVAERNAAKEARVARLRPVLVNLFSSTPDIKSFSTTKTADRVFRHDRAWKHALPDERASVLDSYTAELRAKEEEEERDLKKRNIEGLTALIRTLDISVSTRWRQAHDLVVSSEAFKADADLQKVDTIDILNAYDDYARELEKEHEEESKSLKIKKTREARRARDGFRDLLHELGEKGELTRSSKWKDLYPKIKADERYSALLGHQGSTPLDLFMDVVDDMGEETERAAEKIQKALKGITKEIGIETSWEEFEEWAKEAHMDTQLEARVRKEVYSLVTGKLKQAAADEQRRAERKRRHRIDDLRYALKSVSRLEVDMTYEEALPLIEELKEFKEVEDEADRKSAYDKYIKRQKEKMREAESSEVGSTHERDKDRRQSKSRRDEMDVDEEYDTKDRRRDREKNGTKEDKYRDRDEKYRSERDDKYRDRDERYERESRRDREREKDRESRYKDSDRDDRRSSRNHRDRNGDKERSRSRDRSEDRGRYEDRESRDGRDKDGYKIKNRRRSSRGDEKRRDSMSVDPEERDSKRQRVGSVENGDTNGVEKEAGEVEEGEI